MQLPRGAAARGAPASTRLHASPAGLRLAVTAGDPAGIGPEVLLKALGDPAFQQQAASVTVIATRSLLQAAHAQLALQCREPLADPRTLNVLDVPAPDGIAVGIESTASGEAGWRYLDAAITATLAGAERGRVRGPADRLLQLHTSCHP
jgi:4-hydroxythreonine-4-phosphate dehydrogenase